MTARRPRMDWLDRPINPANNGMQFASGQHMLSQPMPAERDGAFSMIGSAAEPTDGARADFAADVFHGLTSHPKRLSCRWLYDREGSLLFAAICDLPEYYIPRADRAI